MMRALGGTFAVLGAFAATAVSQAPSADQVDTPFGAGRLIHREAAGETAAKCMLWVSYDDDPALLADHARYLADLQARWRDRGLRVGVVLGHSAAFTDAAPGFDVVRLPAPAAETPPEQGEPAKQTPEGQPPPPPPAVPPGQGVQVIAQGRAVQILDITDGIDHEGSRVHAALLGAGDSTPLANWDHLDGALDRIDAVLAGRQPAGNSEEQALEMLLGSVGDGGDIAGPVASVTAALPRSGRARALAVLHEWWCKGDYDAAQQAFADGLRALADESVPLVVFADCVLRGDRIEPSIAKTLAVALAPAAAAAPDGVMTQLTYLRALLRAGQDRQAGRVVATLPRLLAGRGTDQLLFAETLMEAGEPAAHRERAMHAIELAQQGGADRRWLYAARHKVMVRCGDPQADVDALVAEYRGKEDAFATSLNNDAWYMVTQLPSMGRFDTLALAQVREMQRLEGEQMDSGNQDTVALVLFLNGRIREAIDLQKVAAGRANGDPRYLGRLARFENAEKLAGRAGAPAADKK